MGTFQVKDPKAVICVIFAAISVAAAISFLLLLCAYYVDEYPKISNYNNTMCKVNSSTIKSYTCSEKNKKYSCSDIIWKVYHGDFYHILATIKVSRYKYYSHVIETLEKYKVRKSLYVFFIFLGIIT